MQFRWIAFLSLWTLLSGPILAIPDFKENPFARGEDAKKPNGNRAKHG